MSTGAQLCSNVQLDTLISSVLIVNADVQFRTVSPLRCAYTHTASQSLPILYWHHILPSTGSAEMVEGQAELLCHCGHRLQIW